eukprot:11216840-Lingulodinium_polyedra.AAC.1
MSHTPVNLSNDEETVRNPKEAVRLVAGWWENSERIPARLPKPKVCRPLCPASATNLSGNGGDGGGK